MRLDLSLLGTGLVAGVVLSLWLGAVPASSDLALSATPAPQPGAGACGPASVEERAGQVLIAGMPDVVAPNHPLVADLIDLQVGGVLIAKGNVRNAAQVRRLVAAMRDGSERPLLATTDEEPGRVSNFGEVLGRFSSARTLARRGSPADVEVFARQLGVELANLGMDVDLGPVAGVDDGAPQGRIGDRSFSGDPQVASRYALAFTRGLWTGGVLPAPKYFPGTGRARTADPRGLPVLDISWGELRTHDLPPFRAQVRAGVRMMLVGHTVVTALDAQHPASLSPAAYRLLRGIGFDGVAVADALDNEALHRRYDYRDAIVRALNAGADMVLLRDGGKARLMRDAVVAAVAEGRLPDARLSEAVARIMALKGLNPATCSRP